MKIHKKMVVGVSGAGVLFLSTALGLAWKTSMDMRAMVSRQFNAQQMVIARNIAGRMEREMELIKRELLELSGTQAPVSLIAMDSNLLEKSQRLYLEQAGVEKVEILTDPISSPYFANEGKNAPNGETEFFSQKTKLFNTDDLPWVSDAIIKNGKIQLLLGSRLTGDSNRFLVFHLDLSRFLLPILKNVQSGKTGYAWLIDARGRFLFHPDHGFIGESAFTARREKYPDISFKKINFIQQQNMLRGESGTGFYESGWHRGTTGRIKKLIAYFPVNVTGDKTKNWSVAVVAPVAEIESAVQQGNRRLFSLALLLLIFIVSGAMALIFHEVRRVKQMEEEVRRKTEEHRKAEEKYRSLVESADDFIFTVDEKGRLHSVNSFTAVYFGSTADELCGRSLSALFGPEAAEGQMHFIDLVHRLGKSVRNEFQLDVGGHRAWINANFMPLRNKSGEVTLVLCIARDVTEHKQLEKQLVNAEKLASLGTLAAGLAHEINNPLGVILGFCDLLLRKTDPETQVYDDLKTIERQGWHCKKVVENLLSFARLKSNQAKWADLNECLEDMVAIVAHTLEMNRIQLHVDLYEKMPPVKGEARQLQQVFLNLINNAVAAMEPEGHLYIETRPEYGGRRALIRFTDTGKGISPQDLDHIFEPFFTTKPEGEGTGLGLFVSYGIITQYGGSLVCEGSREAVDGKPGGTTFTIRLPFADRGRDAGKNSHPG